MKPAIRILIRTFAVAAVFVILVLMLREPPPRCMGRTIDQWLRALNTDTNSTGSPLRILRMTRVAAHQMEIEVPLSYDLLEKYGFFRYPELTTGAQLRQFKGLAAELWVFINGTSIGAARERGTNGNLVLLAYTDTGNGPWGAPDNLRLGTNEILLRFRMMDLRIKERIATMDAKTNLVLSGSSPILSDPARFHFP